MAKIIGIDFGTTNSLISVVLSGTGTVKSFLNDKRMPHPSVVWYSNDRVVAGRKAKEQLEDTTLKSSNDEIIKSPKSKLGNGPFFINGREIEPASVIADLMRFLVEDGEKNGGREAADFTEAVVSIPVASNAKMRVELRDALLQAGIHVKQFVHEPLAALYGYLRDQENPAEKLQLLDGKMVLVFDWGGGTLDLTLCYIKDGSITQVMNKGDNEVGGDYVDEAIRNYVVAQHLDKFKLDIAPPVTPGARASLLQECEKAKIELSIKEEVLIYVPDYYVTDELYRDLEIRLSRTQLEDICAVFMKRGLGTIPELLDCVQIDQRRIALCLATGGMVSMPAIKQRLVQLFSIDRLEVSKKADRIISEGCAWIAHDGLRMSLAKPLELVEARQSYFTIFNKGTLLPMEGEVIEEAFDVYCVDPRDGKAKIRFVRPKYINKTAQADPRQEYGNLVVSVDKSTRPFMERIAVNFTIDDNFVVLARAISSFSSKEGKCEFYDLEFALSMPSVFDKGGNEHSNGAEHFNIQIADEPQTIGIRSNISSKALQKLVPGELLYSYMPAAFDSRTYTASKEQEGERMYYVRCLFCNRLQNDPQCHCSDKLKPGAEMRVIRARVPYAGS